MSIDNTSPQASIIPLVRKGALVHVGQMNLPPEYVNSRSYGGISVSEHPDEWRRIAGLRGDNTIFHRQGVFLDYDAITRPLEDVMVQWGIENYAIDRTLEEEEDLHQPDTLIPLAYDWVNRARPDLDGIWWSNDYDRCRLGPPHGVIVPNRVRETWLPTGWHDHRTV